MQGERAVRFVSALVLLAGMGIVNAQQPTHKRILVLCTGNSARSQMAAGFLKSFDNRLEVFSAGTQPAACVNPHAIAAMKEVGIDLSGAKPQSVRQFMSQAFDYVITVC